MLGEIEGSGEIGKGRFGTVYLKKFRSSPVAVKYFDESSTAKTVETEAVFLSKCCHFNLPLIFGRKSHILLLHNFMVMIVYKLLNCRRFHLI